VCKLAALVLLLFVSRWRCSPLPLPLLLPPLLPLCWCYGCMTGDILPAGVPAVPD
jgi:hypothetical protein